ncbi:TRAP transporter large permease [Nocardioides hwasunensis]|uniref:TRAP transporter large permease n=1 Tax=Nocardioides hwasunensis TaxID=397258 RepID=A0ABR8ML48_9ACTN|nr:TRAP transporter large permease [Nocardioides hwasunensis]MBD3916749.1 TRAP transporter large permease [Nocardioides hwasunensis]
MSPELIVLISLAIFGVMLMAEAPVAAALLTASITGLLLNAGFERTAATLSSAAYQATSSYSLVVIPMFILMGVFVANAGILANIFDFAARVTRRLPGGLGIATVLSAAGFSAVTGSSAAAVVTLGRMCVTEMTRHGYRVAYAASIVAASGTLGVLIPPSIVLVIYGILTNESVGQLLLAAIIPGILTAVAYMVTVAITASRPANVDAEKLVPAEVATVGAGARPGAGSGPSAAVVDTEDEVGRLREEEVLPSSRRDGRTPFISGREIESMVYIALIAGAVLGGIYGGYFTETEAGAVGALLSLLVLIIRGRQTEGGVWRGLTTALQETAANTAMLMALIIAGSVFTLFLVTTRIPQDLTQWIVGLDVNKYVVVAIILLVLLVLGALIDGMSILLLTMPLTYPIITSLGFDGLWYGIIAVKMIEIGLLTPPFGLNVFMISGVVKKAKVEAVFRGVVPFIIAEMAVVLIIIVFPEVVTWLPSKAG